MQLGFVGTGTMGASMAGCLIDAGHQLTVYDLRPEATAALHARGARSAENPAAVARASEVVFTSLPGPYEVEAAVLEASSGILAGLRAVRGRLRPGEQLPGRRRDIRQKIRSAAYC